MTPSVRHSCLVTQGMFPHALPTITAFLKQGLKDGHQALFLGHPRDVAEVHWDLALNGLDVISEIQRRSLILTSDRSHLQNGRFDVQEMLARGRSSVDQALNYGYKGLYAVG